MNALKLFRHGSSHTVCYPKLIVGIGSNAFVRTSVKWYSASNANVVQVDLPKLREYQQNAIDACIRSIDNGVRRIGVSMATGGGKTVIFSNLIKQLSKVHQGDQKFRTLILVHRRELAFQAASVIKRFSEQELTNVQIEMGKYQCDVDSSDVIIASIQSLLRRLDKYNANDINLIIIDEAHHAVAKSYIDILKHFNAQTNSTKIPIVGFSATFERADHKALSAVLDEIVYHRGIIEMIDEKWLCEGKFTTVDIDVELSDVESTNFDFKLDQLSKVMNTKEVNEVVLQTYLKKKIEHGLKSTLLFAVDVEHVKQLCDLFTRNNIKAKYVIGKTKDSNRDIIVNEFKNGELEILINCGIFTEGTDIPNIDCILLCRPTKSRALLVQMIGRGLRLHHSKAHCNIIDFIGASNVGVISVPTLVGIDKYSEPLDEVTIASLQEIKKEMDIKINEREKRVVEELQESNNIYHSMLMNSTAMDLTLTSYEDFKSFHETYSLDNKASPQILENKYFKDSKYPWVRIAKNAWALSLYSGNHFRLYKETVKSDKDGKLDNANIYTLKLYREIPSYRRNDSGVRFVPKEIIQTEELLNAFGKVEQVFKNLAESQDSNDSGTNLITNFNKYSKWRQQPATLRQKSIIKGKLQRAVKTGEEFKIFEIQILKFIKDLTKGEASNILFATSLAPVFPLKALIRILKLKYKET